MRLAVGALQGEVGHVLAQRGALGRAGRGRKQEQGCGGESGKENRGLVHRRTILDFTGPFATRPATIPGVSTSGNTCGVGAFPGE